MSVEAGTRLDVRLVPAAVGAWGGAALALHLDPARSFRAAGLVAVLGGLALVSAMRRPRWWWAVVATALLFGAAALVGTGTRVAARDASLLTGLAARGAVVALEVTVRDDPRPIGDGFGGEPRVLVAVRATSVRHGGLSRDLEDSVVVLAGSPGWGGLLPGQRLRAVGTLLPRSGVDLTTAVLTARGPPTPLGAPPVAQRAAGGMRKGLVDAARVLPEGPRGLLPGLVLGDVRGLDPVLRQQFQDTGLTHLIAVSGANVAIVVGTVVWLLRRAGASPWWTAAAAGLVLVGFVVLVRPSPSVLRAAAMGAIALIALATGRPRSALPALAATVAVLTLAVSELAWSAGFTLSVAATLGILALAPGLTRRLRARRVPPAVAEALAVSLAAGVVTAPLIAGLSSSVSLVSVPANVMAAAAVPPATVLGVLACLSAPVAPPLAELLVQLAGLPVRWLVLVAERGSALPVATVPWPAGAGGSALLAALLIAVGLILWWAPLLRAPFLAVVLAVGALGVGVRTVAPGWPPAGWLLVACDVGQGDALAVNVGRGDAIVVDAGPDPTAIDRCLRRLGVRRVPLVVLSHLHADHVDGLPGILAGRSVGGIELGPVPAGADALPEVTSTAAAAGVPLLHAALGEVRTVGAVSVEVIGPLRVGPRTGVNDSSLVLRLRAGGLTVLLTGDVEVDGQHALLRAGTDLRADVLKVPHHGSAYQEEAFLAAVHSSLALVSVGADNDYGHPAPSLLRELGRLGMQVVRTDTDGSVAVGRGADGRPWFAGGPRAPPTR